MHIAVFGLGEVGSALASHAARRGHEVRCVDIDEDIVDAIRADEFFEGIDTDSITATTDASTIVSGLDAAVIAVPTPLDSSYTVDLEPVRSAVSELATGLARNGTTTPLVVVESTVPPGTTETVVRPLFEEQGLTVGEDVFLAVAPERVDPGNDEWPLDRIPRVVGAVTNAGRDLAVDFYEELLTGTIHPVESPSVAEASKIVENAFRDINIAFVNEVAVSLGELGIDANSVLDAAATKPFGFMRFTPGAGVGGHCIPVDPYLLIEPAGGAGFDHRFLKLAREINSGMPEYVVEQVIKGLNDTAVVPKEATVTILGRSFKPGVTEDRNSPYHEIVAGLEEYGIETMLFDPYWPDASVETPYTTADAIVLVTAHDSFSNLDWTQFADLGVDLVVDGRNLFDPEAVTASGLQYRGIGRTANPNQR